MTEKHTEFIGSIPETYDTHLGPLFFEYYAADLARRIDVPARGRVLETACGTGIATEFLRAALPENVEIVATDLNEPMLDFARARRGDLPNVRFQQADALDLPFEDNAFDAVICQFGLMFLPDKPAGVRQAARVLKPGGRFVFNVWDSLEWNPVAQVAQETIGGYFDTDPPTFLLIPFGFHELDPIKTMLLEAGLTDIEISIVPTVIERPSARHTAVGFVEGNPGVHEILDRATAPPEAIIDAVAEAFRDAFGDAPLRTPLQAIVVSASRMAG